MSQFAENYPDFSVECQRENGRCLVARENIYFLDGGNELAAVDQVQQKCWYVAIIPDTSFKGHALLYHTGCRRMIDMLKQVFQNCLEEPVGLRQHTSEMTLGELHRRRVTISYRDCRARVKGFSFPEASPE